MARLTIRARVLTGFSVIVTGALIVGALGLWGMDSLDAGTRSLHEAASSLMAVSDVRALSLEVRRYEKDFMLNAGQTAAQADYVQKWRTARDDLQGALQRLGKLVADEPDTVAEVVEAQRAVGRYTDGFEVVVKAGADPSNGPAELNRLIAPVKDEIRTVIAVAEKVAEKQGRAVETTAAEAARVARQTRWTVGALLAAVLALAVITAAGTVRQVVRDVRGVVREAERLRAAVEAGQLGTRGEREAVGSEFAPIVEGFNATLDAYARPIALTSSTLVRLSSGDVPAPITERAEGDFNEIKDALNRCIAAVGALVEDVDGLARAGAEGRLEVRADARRHQGDYRRIVEGMNHTLDAVVGPITTAAGCVGAIARGEIPPPITASYQGEFEVLRQNLNTCTSAVRALVEDARRLSAAAVSGQLQVRADASRHSGDFRAIVQGVNDTLDAIVGPFREVADYCERISRGDIPPRHTAQVQGEIVAMQQSLNRCVDALSILVADVNAQAGAAVAGRLSARIETARHAGAFREALEGMNRTLDAVTAPVDEATRALERLAARDLRARVEGDHQGDHARLKEALNGTAGALHEALTQVASAVDQVASAATQIASSAQSVASGASEQAASLAQSSASMASVSYVTQQVSADAQRATSLVTVARTAAVDGGTAVERLQAAVGSIKASAEGTSQIIRDVTDIAFQTNLLALNAAVEAARAGDAGRGFAVVAEEVRSLALRAKDAANRTEALIRQSVNQAAEGESAAKLVASRLGEIGRSVEEVTTIIQALATSARTQANGIAEMNTAVGEMDKVTQQNAASAEESSSSASELSSQAEELAAMVATFQLEAGHAPSTRSLARPRRGSLPA